MSCEPLLDWSLAVNLLKRRSGKSHCALARSLGMHPHTMAKLSSGTLTSPRMDSGVRILDACYDVFEDGDWQHLRATLRLEVLA